MPTPMSFIALPPLPPPPPTIAMALSRYLNCLLWRELQSTLLTPISSRFKRVHLACIRSSKYAQSIGVKKGDTVAIYMPMIVDLVVVMLACARIGAPHSIVVCLCAAMTSSKATCIDPTCRLPRFQAMATLLLVCSPHPCFLFLLPFSLCVCFLFGHICCY